MRELPDLADLLSERISIDAPKAAPAPAYSPNVQLPLPHADYDLPNPLSSIPDMSNYGTAQNWVKAGATQVPYGKIDPTMKKNYNAILNFGYTDCLCGETLQMYAYWDLFEENDINKLLCGKTAQAYIRSKRSDDQILKITDYSLGIFLVTQDCSILWKDGDYVALCAVQGNGKVWQPVDVGQGGGVCVINDKSVQYTAFFKTSDAKDSDGNLISSVPHLQFKLTWNMDNPPVPNGKGSAIDLQNDYDPTTKTLVTREHYAYGQTKCGYYSKSILPPLDNGSDLDDQPWNYNYVAYHGLQPPLTTQTTTDTNLITQAITTAQSITSQQIAEPPPSSFGKISYLSIPFLATLGAVEFFRWRGNRIVEKKRKGIR